MKLNSQILTLIFILLNIQNLNADEEYTFGIGLGNSSYGGLGTNIGIVSDTDMKYLSTGLKSYSSYDGFTYSIGIGWIKTDLIKNTSNKHGLGVYIGQVDKEYHYQEKDKNVYGYGFTYNYFFNGINRSGINLGLSLINYSYSYEDKVLLSLEFGYQF